MKVNKETALRIWNKQFGKENKGVDFAGRTIAKSAYNDRNSKFAWNVDHIKPESVGGKTADHNLVCCHILTNDEKADNFPNFKANGKTFQIHKRENHYEIFEQSKTAKKTDKKNSAYDNGKVNFLDASQGIHFWKECRKKDNDTWLGFVKVSLEIHNHNDFDVESFFYFLKELFPKTCIVDNTVRSWYDHRHVFTIIDYDLPHKKDIQNLLDTCIVLNTYADCYFYAKYNVDIQIICGAMSSDGDVSISSEDLKEQVLNYSVEGDYTLAIDDLVRINTDASKKELESVNSYSRYRNLYHYDYYYTKLQKNLEKRFKSIKKEENVSNMWR